jgi:hypothetical protein
MRSMNARAGLAFALTTAFACGGSDDKKDAAVAPMRVTGVLSAAANREVDVVFVVDDSSSMAPAQARLAAGFPMFMDTLRALPGGAPDLHVAVVSSDMGAGDGSIDGCAGNGKAGRFQFTPRGACTATNLQPGATFIADASGVTNYTGAIEDVFRCIAPLGETGCGFEQPFAALTRALGADGSAPPTENQGFLRPDARLAIVLVTNEDDCTPRTGVALFDTAASATLASPLGPPTSFRCNEFGHVCDGSVPRRLAPNDMVGDMFSYDSCIPAEDAGMLKNVAETVLQLRALKADPARQMLVASIQAPPAPYVVHWRDPLPPDTMPWPEITHSCTSFDQLSFGDPGVRTAELARGFGPRGFVFSVCDDSYSSPLTSFAQAIGDLFAPSCIVDPIADDLARSGIQPDCRVTAHTGDDTGAIVDSTVPACADSGGTPPCWSLVPGGPLCVGQVLQVVPDVAAPPPASLSISYDCAVCTPGVAVLGCP